MTEDADVAWSPENAAYWQAARAGRLLVKRCTACGRSHYYPRARCPFCASPETVWTDASGLGEIYSYSIVRRAEPPYVTAYVTLAEGVTLLTNIVDCDPETLRIGQRVRVVFRAVEDGRQAPMFTPDNTEDPHSSNLMRERVQLSPASGGITKSERKSS